jgi:REase_MTES_1575
MVYWVRPARVAALRRELAHGRECKISARTHSRPATHVSACGESTRSAGDVEDARRLLAGISRWRAAEEPPHDGQQDPLSMQLADELHQHGYAVDLGVGQSHFRVDLGVRKDGEAGYRLGILVDTLASYEQSDALERDMLRPRLLRDFGWRVTAVLAKDWYESRQRELARLLELLEGREVRLS